jgi:hypothetical protein
MKKVIPQDGQTKNTLPKVGQFYQLRNKDSIYNGNVFILVEAAYGSYALIDLSDGVNWDETCENIKDVFGGSEKDFHLIEPPITIIPDYN